MGKKLYEAYPNNYYTYREKTPSGYFLVMAFDNYQEGAIDKPIIWDVSLAIHKKKKRAMSYAIFSDKIAQPSQNLNLLQTGPASVEGLLLAKEVLEDFVYMHMKVGEKLRVTGEDSRRYRVYKRGLESLGFKEVRPRILMFEKTEGNCEACRETGYRQCGEVVNCPAFCDIDCPTFCDDNCRDCQRSNCVDD